MLKYKLFLLLCLFTNSCWSVSIYNPENNQLHIPKVLVGNVIYENIIVTISNVISVGAQPAKSNLDSYDLNTGILTIPEVLVSSNSTNYYNVAVTLGDIIHLNGISTNVASKNIIWRQSSNSITLTNDWLNNLSYEGYGTFDFEGLGEKSFFFHPGTIAIRTLDWQQILIFNYLN